MGKRLKYKKDRYDRALIKSRMWSSSDRNIINMGDKEVKTKIGSQFEKLEFLKNSFNDHNDSYRLGGGIKTILNTANFFNLLENPDKETADYTKYITGGIAGAIPMLLAGPWGMALAPQAATIGYKLGSAFTDEYFENENFVQKYIND